MASRNISSYFLAELRSPKKLICVPTVSKAFKFETAPHDFSDDFGEIASAIVL